MKGIEDELQEFCDKIISFSIANAPKWLTPNSNFVGIKPGHNLDLLEIAFDFRIDRTHVLFSKESVPEVLLDPSKPNLKVVT